MNMQLRNVTPEAEDFLDSLADELEIPEYRYEQAEKSYKSLGDWLNRENSTIRQFGPQVYSQGSFALGTVIAPISDEEHYDVDAVTEFKKLSKREITQRELKRRLGVEVEAYRRAQSMTKPAEEHRRCSVVSFVYNFRFRFIALFAYLTCFTIVATSSHPSILLIASTILLFIAVITYGRAIRSVFSPSALFRIYSSVFSTKRGLVAKSIVLDDDVKAVPVQIMTADQLKKWTEKLGQAVIINRICLFAAKKLQRFHNSGFVFTSGALTVVFFDRRHHSDICCRKLLPVQSCARQLRDDRATDTVHVHFS